MTQLSQPIAAFVYCNRQVPPAGATSRRETERARELCPR